MCIIWIKKKKNSFTYQKKMKGHEQIQGKTGFLCHHFQLSYVFLEITYTTCPKKKIHFGQSYPPMQ